MYPNDFPVPEDQGGPGAGEPIGGFGGNPAIDRDAHRAVLAQLGKAPVLLVHGNGGTADIAPWDMLDQRRFLLAAGYSDELIWAPSYLGAGGVDLTSPHTNNVNDLRDYLTAVCDYLGVEVVDVIAHSLGCTLMYSVFRGLANQASPISWDRPKNWSRVGTFVSLAGAFHGLGAGSVGEWQTGGEFMTELLQETEGGGGETPYAAGKAQTPGPLAHSISYFCAVASGDFVDAQNPGTGQLAGATNRDYNLGTGTEGHQEIKENQGVFNDFLPLLNVVPPTPPVVVTLDPDSGEYPSPLLVTALLEPADGAVTVTASRLLKRFEAGHLVDEVAESTTGTVRNGETVSLDAAGRWEVTAGSGVRYTRTYWVGVRSVTAGIVTDNSAPFDNNLLVTASTTDPTATLYYSFDDSTQNATWTVGATAAISADATVSFIAINPQGVASDIVSRSFTKRIAWDDAVTADAVNHFLAGRIDVTEYLSYSDQFGFFTPFTLYLIEGNWVLDPNQASALTTSTATRTTRPAAGEPATAGPLVIQVSAGSVPPGRYPLAGKGNPFTIGIEVVSNEAVVVQVHYTRDGSIPTAAAPAFSGDSGTVTARFEFKEPGNHVIACYAADGRGNSRYRAFAYTLVAEDVPLSS